MTTNQIFELEKQYAEFLEEEFNFEMVNVQIDPEPDSYGCFEAFVDATAHHEGYGDIWIRESFWVDPDGDPYHVNYPFMAGDKRKEVV